MKKYIMIAVSVIILVITYSVANYFHILPQKYFNADDFGIDVLYSNVDYNKNGIDDYLDILLGARQDAENNTIYDGSYCQNGYPSDKRGVCTDLIWRAFKNAGYSLKDMVDKDIAKNINKYPRVYGEPDPNIDFRRVANLKIFFERYAQKLTCDASQISQWQPGDIFISKTSHIGIISDRRNKDGVPYVIHNAGQPMREEDSLIGQNIDGHYRFDASKIEPSVLVAWITK